VRFLLVDQILELNPLKSIVTTKQVAADEDYFADHFPGYPVVPGVLQVEMMAQSAGKCLMAGISDEKWPVLLQVRQANFRKSVVPQASLRIEAQILSCNDSTATASAKIWCETQVVADATLVFGFIEKSLLAQGFQDEVLTAYLRSADQTVIP
jgi:3-hydroxyacyl-[acyl-carrier-protein] dehydratase